jgi:adenine phosphoribosyltransferase
MNKLKIIEKSIRTIEDFPKPGISFKDITTLLNNAEAFEALMSLLEERYVNSNIDTIVGLESRGFIFGAALATRLKLPFVPIRKANKLPHNKISQEYTLEYGVDVIEIHQDAFNGLNLNVLIIDDLLATGGTVEASIKLVEKLNATVVETCFIIELLELNGINKIHDKIKTFSLIKI